MSKGQATIGAVIATSSGVLAFVGSIIAPTIYIGDIKQTNAVQNTQIEALKEEDEELVEALKEQKVALDKLREDIIVIRAYFDKGVAERLQLDKIDIYKQAALISSTTKND